MFAVSVRAGCLRARRYVQDVRYRHKNGSTVIVLCQGRVVDWDDTGAPLRMIGTHTDVTKIRQQAKAVTERKVNECVRFPALPSGSVGVSYDTAHSSTSSSHAQTVRHTRCVLAVHVRSLSACLVPRRVHELLS